MDFTRAGLPEPPPWRREEDYEPPEPGFVRVSGYVSKPELQKLNRNSIYIFANGRLIRDRLILHALTEGYRNIISPSAFPVVLLFLEMPPQEVDVNVHPAKTEVRFRQQAFVHDFVRDAVRTALMKARPAASFLTALHPSHDVASSLLVDVSPLPGAADALQQPHGLTAQSEGAIEPGDVASFELQQQVVPPSPGRLEFAGTGMAIGYDDVAEAAAPRMLQQEDASSRTMTAHAVEQPSLDSLASLRPLGQLQDSFILR